MLAISSARALPHVLPTHRVPNGALERHEPCTRKRVRTVLGGGASGNAGSLLGCLGRIVVRLAWRGRYCGCGLRILDCRLYTRAGPAPIPVAGVCREIRFSFILLFYTDVSIPEKV